MGTFAPSRRTALKSVPLMSRFRVSPNSYGREMPPDSTPVARSRVSCRPKLLRPSEPSKSCSVLNPRKSMVLSVISKRASVRSCGWPIWPRAEVCGGGVTCGGCCGLMKPWLARRSVSLSSKSFTASLFMALGSFNISRSSSLMALSGNKSPSCKARKIASRSASIERSGSICETP